MKELLLLLVFALPANSFADDSDRTASPRSFHWQRKAGEEPGNVWLVVMPPRKDLPVAKPGCVKVSVEPGCLLPDAIVEALPGNRYRIEFPDDDYFSRQARQVLGLKGKACIITYQAGGKNQSNKVLKLTGAGVQKPADKP